MQLTLVLTRPILAVVCWLDGCSNGCRSTRHLLLVSQKGRARLAAVWVVP